MKLLATQMVPILKQKIRRKYKFSTDNKHGI